MSPRVATGGNRLASGPRIGHTARRVVGIPLTRAVEEAVSPVDSPPLQLGAGTSDELPPDPSDTHPAVGVRRY